VPLEIVHSPVLAREVVDFLNIVPGGIYVDATVGLGGHAKEIVSRIGSDGRIIGIDRDEEALIIASERLSDGRIILTKGKFSDMETIVHRNGISQVDGVIFDIGVSMAQLKNHSRGFSYNSDDRLDMRMDTESRLSAWEVVNTYPEKELGRILHEFGEERFSKKIARAIIDRRKEKRFETCRELSNLVEQVYRKRGRIHPATRTFQALRIEVNRELDELRAGLDASALLLRKGGRLCVISYHSLEDRIVKRCFIENAKNGLFKILTKKPVIPGTEELRSNPSSRSAKLRSAEKL
jgi:16S rRNA (cytosine1402-N4)-methyltransferase